MGFRLKRPAGQADQIMELLKQDVETQEAAVPSQKPQLDRPLIESGANQVRPRPMLSAAKPDAPKFRFGVNSNQKQLIDDIFA